MTDITLRSAPLCDDALSEIKLSVYSVTTTISAPCQRVQVENKIPVLVCRVWKSRPS